MRRDDCRSLSTPTRCTSDAQELRRKCQNFATALLDHTRTSYELEVLLNYDPTGPAFEHGDRMHLSRLKMAIRFKQKKVSLIVPLLMTMIIVRMMQPVVKHWSTLALFLLLVIMIRDD